ncbi:hypothetical protein ES703_12672 [subsurface metagenome]
MNSIQEVAALSFTAVTVQIAIALVVLRPSSRELREILDTIEPHQRLAAVFQSKELIPLCLALGIISFVITIVLGSIALIGIAAPMLGFNWGPYQESNFEWSRYFVAVSTLTFVIGFYFIGVAYFIRVLRFMPRKKRSGKKASESS